MAIHFDYHSHHSRCGHAAGEMADYIEAAKALGLAEFGVSDHCPAFFFDGDDPTPQTSMAKSELPGYVAEARALKERYAGWIAVKVGIEADFVDGSEEVYRRTLAAHPFDYVLGSVHWVGETHIFDRSRWEREDPEATYAAYYRLVALAAQSGMFDILSHLTAIEAYGPPVEDALARRLYPPLVEAVAAAGTAVEVNTSGFRKMGGDDPFPNRSLLRLLADARVPLTFGSDAHRPDEVGYAQGRVEAILRDLGLDVMESRDVTVRRGPIKAFTR
jgi:histidinol-phosphatase (PHP family)